MPLTGGSIEPSVGYWPSGDVDHWGGGLWRVAASQASGRAWRAVMVQFRTVRGCRWSLAAMSVHGRSSTACQKRRELARDPRVVSVHRMRETVEVMRRRASVFP